MKNSKTLILTMITAALAVASYNANAALISCSAAAADDVSGSNACQISTETQDKLNPTLTVNDEGFFGISDWSYAGKKNIGGADETGAVDIGFSVTGNAQSGTWSIASGAWSSWTNIMLIFKDGRDTTITGFKLADSGTSGTWQSPFHAPDFSVGTRIKDVSHITAYVSGEKTTVPEPMTTLLLGAGLIGMGFAARRAKS